MKVNSFLKISVIAVSVATSLSAFAGISLINNEKGNFAIGGVGVDDAWCKFGA
ncbi:MAG: hypothetical protein ACJAT7_003155 [Psychromonas sp.]|jgi:hypothetical protein|uniref:hypothetical protein n=1 Tax=Psychromonas sp. TaxID=1884585 RepID=UPI0039E49DCF